ncbi:MAG: glycosyltransferase family 2 protein [Actinobacteria bacterium]|nr:glycosyltransferase family 2 protein [Actinomycetota bacterium]
MPPTVSFVIPVLDERETLPALADRLAPVLDELGGDCEVVLVDDGSTDGSFDVMRELHERDPRFRALRLSRNFGHQPAITAGLEHASGQAVIIMDGDLQDPPEVAIDLVRKWREGFDVVYAVRDERDGESRVKVTTARWFYRLMGRLSEVEIPVDAGDFRLVDRRVADAVISMPEHRRYLRGMFAWVGFDQVGVHYERDARHAGTTKFSMGRMLAFAADGIVSFSTVPLRMAMTLGFVVSGLSFLAVLYGIGSKVLGHVVPGWASIVVSMGLLGGVQLMVLGVIGEYLARVHDEVKRRPLYLLRDQVGDVVRVAERRDRRGAVD